MELRNQILDLIRNAVHEMIGDAKIILFGSRARGDYHDNSDWDVLILVDVPKLTQTHKDINYELWRKGLDYGQEINAIIRTTDEWNRNPSLFKHNVTKDGILL